MIDQVDKYYGQILDRLETLGENLDGTVIAYTADRGDMLRDLAYAIYSFLLFSSLLTVAFIFPFPSHRSPHANSTAKPLHDAAQKPNT